MTRIWIGRHLLVGMALLAVACSSDDKTTAPGDDNPAVGSVSGIVALAGGDVLEGVTVSLGNRTASTNEGGWFAFTDVPAASGVAVGFTMTGLLPSFRTVDVLAGQTTHLPDVELQPAETVILSGAAGGEAAASDGDGSASFPANAFVTGTGAAYTGDVVVQIGVAVPGDADFYQVFPGGFEGETAGGTTVPFISYGFMGLSLEAGRGEPLFLADGIQAELSLRVASEDVSSAPATIPMWYFDEDRGIWVEEGEAVLQGNTYVGQVEHFTIWNWDLPTTDICLITGHVEDEDGDPVPDARVFSQGLGCTFQDVAYADAAGNFSIRTINDCEAILWALKGASASQTENLVVGSDDTQPLPVPLVLSVPAFSITLSWGVEPEDLDSHLLVPMPWNASYDYYHIYYDSMGNIAADPHTALDTDDTDSFGPEIIGGTHLYPGTYSYYVHHYSGDGTMAASPTTVTLEAAGIYRTWRASSASGTFHEGGYYEDQDLNYFEDYWHVFDLVVSEQGSLSVVSRNQAVGSEEGPWWVAGVTIFEESLKSSTKHR